MKVAQSSLEINDWKKNTFYIFINVEVSKNLIIYVIKNKKAKKKLSLITL